MRTAANGGASRAPEGPKPVPGRGGVTVSVAGGRGPAGGTGGCQSVTAAEQPNFKLNPNAETVTVTVTVTALSHGDGHPKWDRRAVTVTARLRRARGLRGAGPTRIRAPGPPQSGSLSRWLTVTRRPGPEGE
jgi:hypothetical protein